jgi:hypothetical protein
LIIVSPPNNYLFTYLFIAGFRHASKPQEQASTSHKKAAVSQMRIRLLPAERLSLGLNP